MNRHKDLTFFQYSILYGLLGTLDEMQDSLDCGEYTDFQRQAAHLRYVDSLREGCNIPSIFE